MQPIGHNLRSITITTSATVSIPSYSQVASPLPSFSPNLRPRHLASMSFARTAFALRRAGAAPSTALQPFRAAKVANAAFISSSTKKPASEAVPARAYGAGNVTGGPGAPPPMKKSSVEVPLPSQEGSKGVVEYALYVEALSSKPAGNMLSIV